MNFGVYLRVKIGKTCLTTIVKKSLSFATNVWGKSFILYRQKKILRPTVIHILNAVLFLFNSALQLLVSLLFFIKDSC